MKFKGVLTFFWEVFQVVAIALIIVLPIRYFVFQPFIVFLCIRFIIFFNKYIFNALKFSLWQDTK